MTAESPLSSIISNKIIDKISAGTITDKEVLDLNSKLLKNYLNISKDTSDRLKRSTKIYDFWRDTLQNIGTKADYNKFLSSINTIINAIPNSMLGQFTKLYSTNILPTQNNQTVLLHETKITTKPKTPIKNNVVNKNIKQIDQKI